MTECKIDEDRSCTIIYDTCTDYLQQFENEDTIHELKIPDHRKIAQNEMKQILQSFPFLPGFSLTTFSAIASSGDPSFPATD